MQMTATTRLPAYWARCADNKLLHAQYVEVRPTGQGEMVDTANSTKQDLMSTAIEY
jgi:hypothetical protein